MPIPSIYQKYITDPTKEQGGIVKDFGDFVITVARAGGSNSAYGKVMAELFAPYEQVMALDQMQDEIVSEIWHKVLCRTVIKYWSFKEPSPENPKQQTLVAGLGRDEGGNIVEATEENICELFKQAKELFVEIRVFAEQRENYSLLNRQAATKN